MSPFTTHRCCTEERIGSLFNDVWLTHRAAYKKLNSSSVDQITANQGCLKTPYSGA